MSLISKVTVATKSTKMPLPGHPTFIVEVGYCSRVSAMQMLESSKEESLNAAGDTETKLNSEAFSDKIARHSVKGWEGLTYEILSTLVLVDTSAVEDMTAEIPYSHEDAVYLIRNSSKFDKWINNVIYELSSFRDRKEG